MELHARSATSKALYTTEILKHILSYLSGPDLIAAVDVNDFFYNCAANSPDIQEIMFLRPSNKPQQQLYRIIRYGLDSNGNHRKIFMIAFTPSALPNDQYGGVIWRCRALRLCPALRLFDSQWIRNNRAKGVCYGNKSYKDGKVAFAVRPTDVGRFGSHMFVSDPPVTKAKIHLRYEHTKTHYVVVVDHDIDMGCPLTFDAIFEEAESSIVTGCIHLGTLGKVSEDRYRWFMNNWTLVDDVTFSEVTSEHIKTFGGSFVLDLEESWMELGGVVPTEEEWETMYEVLAEEESKKQLVGPDA